MQAFPARARLPERGGAQPELKHEQIKKSSLGKLQAFLARARLPERVCNYKTLTIKMYTTTPGIIFGNFWKCLENVGTFRKKWKNKQKPPTFSNIFRLFPKFLNISIFFSKIIPEVMVYILMVNVL